MPLTFDIGIVPFLLIGAAVLGGLGLLIYLKIRNRDQ